MLRHVRRALTALVVAVAPLTAQQAVVSRGQISPDTLAGRVVTDSGAPVAAVPVVVTRGPDRAVFRTMTDADGRWRMVVDSGTGDYLVYVAATGFKPSRTRVTRAGAETRLDVVLTLTSSAPSTLATVTVVARKREAPQRGGVDLSMRANAETPVDGVASNLSPAQAGDIASMAGTIPGLQVTPSGIAALGLTGGTLVTLNGMGFAGAELPRGVPVTTRVSTTTWDVARGGFSGAQVDVSVEEGSFFKRRSFTSSFDAPALQVSDASARALGVPIARLDLNAASSGPIDAHDRFAYSVGMRLRRRTAHIPSLATASDQALRTVGASPDSVRALIATLATLGAPAARLGGSSRTDVQLLGRVNRISYSAETFEPTPRTYGVVGYLSVSDESGVGRSALDAAATAATRRDLVASVQGEHSLRSATWLRDSKVAVSLQRLEIDPGAFGPVGTVRIAGATANDGGLASMRFGAGDALARDLTRVMVDATHTANTFVTANRRHRLKLFAQARVDLSRDAAVPGAAGQYSYLSLNDLRLNQPASYSRVLTQPERRGATLNGAVGVGSTWRRSQFFSMEYGLRSEVNQFLTTPEENAVLASSLGVSTRSAPTRVGLSPRIGVRWVYAKKVEGGGIFFARDAMRYQEVNGILRAGIGEFRNFISPEFLAGPMAGTGVPNASIARLLCVGATVPTADWGGFASGATPPPSQCATGAPGLGAIAAPVSAIDPAWRTPRAWRASLGWSAAVRGTTVSVEGIGSLNLDQPATVDANFAGVSQGTLAAEENRPVYARAADIAPTTGLISPTASRRDPAYAGVRLLMSSARSVSSQLRINVDPPYWKGLFTRGTYVVGQVRSRENGFDQNTAGDPHVTEWTPSTLDVRHQVQLQASYGWQLVSLSGFLNVFSGTPFTPIVQGDINGDGLAFNDRAYVSRTVPGDSVASAQLATLFANSPAAVQRCLRADEGRSARRNGCRGPWTATLNASLSASFRRGAFREPIRVALFFENPLAAVDRVLHGQNIRGWGTVAAPDPTLLAVRGFDPVSGRFAYEVNSRFGATDPLLSAVRAPFRATIDVTVPLGATLPQQQLARSLRDGRTRPGPRLDVAQLKARYARNVSNPMAGVLDERDSLFLSAEQVRQIDSVSAVFQTRVDSVWTELATYLTVLEQTYNEREALERQERATDAAWEIARQESQVLTRILLPVQLPLLPWPASYLRTAKPGMKIRIFTG